jgi:subtilisin family serine protease
MNFPKFALPAAFLLTLSLASALTGRAAADLSVESVPGELLIGLRPTAAPDQSASQIQNGFGTILGTHPALRALRMKVRSGLSIEAAMAGLLKRSDVLYVERNTIYHTTSTPNDPGFASQYGPQKVQADLAWGIWQPKASVIVAIVDTGIDYTHPDLTNKILRSGGVVVGYNAVGSNARSGISTDPIDDMGHGTHCAGIAAAQVNNGTGVAGISGWDGTAGSSDTSTQLMPVKVLDSTGSGTDATVSSGITWAADHGAKVISLSLGGGGTTTLSNAVAYAQNKGCLIVAAAGNSGSSGLSYPAAYANVISVAATDSTDTLAYYSNYGSWVKVAAPGSNIYSTLPVVPTGGGFGTNYGTLSGTSMATPHVAGEAALLFAQNPTLTSAQVSSLITSNVDPYSPYSGHTIATGAGRINVYKALQAAGGSIATAPAAPTNLTATAGDSLVSLTWTASSGATSYNVKRATTNGGPYTTAASGGSTSYTDTGLTNGTTYYYVVTAVNSVGESGNSNQASATPAASQPSQQLLANPGFESGATGWTASSGVIDSSIGEAAHSGAWKAWLCGYGTTHTDTLSQQVTIPSTLTSATLTFWLHIDSAETNSRIYDTLKVQIRNSAGTVLATLATYSNRDKAAGYSQKTFNLSAYKGQAIQVYLVGAEDSSLQTSFVVDDFALTVK